MDGTGAAVIEAVGTPFVLPRPDPEGNWEALEDETTRAMGLLGRTTTFASLLVDDGRVLA
jgi:hypothetical protein